VFGTRPEAIKMAPLVLGLKKFPSKFDVKVVVTAQHRKMLDQVLEIFEITPDIDLNLMQPGQQLSQLTAHILEEMNSVLEKEKPDLVLVHGDTTTTFATALSCFYNGIKIGHVEAGLRTYQMHSPFPEEFNRQAVSKITDFHFAPTSTCKENLVKEGVSESSIAVTGNTVVDSIHWTLNLLDTRDDIREPVVSNLVRVLGFDWTIEQFILVTGHRRENFGDGFQQICAALAELGSKFPQMHFVYPVHLNPNVQVPVQSTLGNLPNIHLIQPLDYLSFTSLLRNCKLVLTDSGGIQEEAPSLGKPVVLMRETTERPEALEAGTIRLVGANKERIVTEVTKLLEDEISYKQMVKIRNPFGNGDSVELIIDYLIKTFKL
jgi:UDP-N-acetylglucosamine 2-epimerase (non-hydrolysing)